MVSGHLWVIDDDGVLLWVAADFDSFIGEQLVGLWMLVC